MSKVISIDEVIESINKMQGTYRKLYTYRHDEYYKGFADGLEYALMELRGELDELF